MQPEAKLEKGRENWGKARQSAFYSHVENAANMHSSNSGSSNSSVVSTYAGDSKRKREKRRNKGNAEGEYKGEREGRECGEGGAATYVYSMPYKLHFCLLQIAVCIVWCIARKSMLRFVQKGVQGTRERKKVQRRLQQGLSGIGIQSDTHTHTHRRNNDTRRTLDWMFVNVAQPQGPLARKPTKWQLFYAQSVCAIVCACVCE